MKLKDLCKKCDKDTLYRKIVENIKDVDKFEHELKHLDKEIRSLIEEIGAHRENMTRDKALLKEAYSQELLVSIDLAQLRKLLSRQCEKICQ